MLIGCSPSSGGDLPTPGPKCSNDVEAAKLRSSLYAMAMIIPESIPVFAAQCCHFGHPKKTVDRQLANTGSWLPWHMGLWQTWVP
jgi:hypothetical protein